MFGLFRSRKFADANFGELFYEGGYWRCLTVLDPCGEVPLAIAGSNEGPDSLALAEAYQLRSRFPNWQAPVAKALFEHFEPYAEAFKDGDFPEFHENLLNIETATDALSRSMLRFVAISPISGIITTELGYETEWDEEHMLGVRFKGEKFFELCGSTVPA